MKIKGVIFDMDGLMIDTEKIYNHYLCRAANELGYPMTREHALLLRSLDEKQAGPLMQQYLGREYDHEKVLKLYRGYIREYFAAHEIERKPGLFELLEYLTEHGYRTCVATATEKKTAKAFLERIGAAKYFDELCSGSELEHSKPAPDIYLKAAREIGCDPKECLALEDSPNGVRSAHAAGCRTVMVPDLTRPDKELRDTTFAVAETLFDVISILEKADIPE